LKPAKLAEVGITGPRKWHETKTTVIRSLYRANIEEASSAHFYNIVPTRPKCVSFRPCGYIVANYLKIKASTATKKDEGEPPSCSN
jgi:hypothetical protein